MPNGAAPSFRERYGALQQRLAGLGAPKELETLKAEIGALFKQLEQEIGELSTLRDDVKQLVERWKTLRAEHGGNGNSGVHGAVVPPSNAPQFTGERPVVRADHIGASTFIEKGWSKLSLGDHEGAEASLRKALDLSPNDPQAEALLGWALMLQEKYDDALLMFQKVLMRQPQNALARINVGYICLKKRIFGEAIEHLSRAIRLDNDKKAMLYAHFYLGLVYLERDMFEDAQTFFRKTIALGPGLIEAYFELGRAFWFNGQRDEAIETWKSGFAANKFNPWGKRCAEVLTTVEKGGEP
ncbi:MAG TPA: tetratricopeptide repeat protein [Gemmatimonadaceae bacterium]|nr:tetratricopeptide repeat protein [Gemmatimonadaceae bacterium]